MLCREEALIPLIIPCVHAVIHCHIEFTVSSFRGMHNNLQYYFLCSFAVVQSYSPSQNINIFWATAKLQKAKVGQVL